MERVLSEINTIWDNCKRLNLDFIVRTSRSGIQNEYLAFEVPIAKEIVEDIKTLVIINLEENIKKLELVEFSPVIKQTGTLEYLGSQQVNNLNNICKAINSIDKMPIENLDFKNIWGYSIRVIYDKEGKEEITTFFKKFSYPKILNKSIVMSLKNGAYNKIEEKVITIDSTAHSFLMNDVMYVLNKSQFEKFFNFSTAYERVVTESVQKLEKLDVIENFAEFSTNCLESDTLTRRFVKIIQDKKFENLQKNIKNVPKVIEDFALSVNFENDKIIYDENSTITDIITLIRGACVYGALDNERYLAADTKSVEQV